MTPKRKNRLILVLLILAGVGGAAFLGVKALDQNLLYYFSPLQIKNGEAPIDHSFRLGGLVADGSVVREKDGLTMRFNVTDYAETIAVTYVGLLPDLFREGQGIVATGKLDGTIVDTPKGKFPHFVAEDVLAKHDENYMPPAVEEALEKGKEKADKAASGETAQ